MVYLPLVFTCCFACSTNHTKACVESLLESLPAAAWPQCRDRMLMPILRRLAELDRRMPLSWLDLAKPLAIRPVSMSVADDLILVRYWQLCSMVRSGWKPEFFKIFESLAASILSLVSPDSGFLHAKNCELYFQIKLIKNEDHVLRIVINVARSKWVRDWRSYVKYLARCGGLNYALALAKNIKNKRPFVTKAFVSQLEDEIAREDHLRLTAWSALKDKESSLHALGTDVLRMVLERAREPEVILWEDVLRDFIEHDIGAAV